MPAMAPGERVVVEEEVEGVLLELELLVEDVVGLVGERDTMVGMKCVGIAVALTLEAAFATPEADRLTYAAQSGSRASGQVSAMHKLESTCCPPVVMGGPQATL